MTESLEPTVVIVPIWMQEMAEELMTDELIIPKDEIRKAVPDRYFGGNKEAVLARDGGKCRQCGHPTVVVHHIDGKGRGHKNPDNSMSNLITLCNRCHGKTHNPPVDMEYEVMKLWEASNRQIASQLKISHSTVAKIRRLIREKFPSLGRPQFQDTSSNSVGEWNTDGL